MLFKGFKESICDLVKYQRKVPRGNASATLRSVSVETIQETSEIFILADINGRIFSAMADLYPSTVLGCNVFSGTDTGGT